jgi:hypothetical protein
MVSMNVENVSADEAVSVTVDRTLYTVTFGADRMAAVPRRVGMELVTAGLCRDHGPVRLAKDGVEGPWPSVTPAWPTFTGTLVPPTLEEITAPASEEPR